MLTQERGEEAIKSALNLGYREHLWKSQTLELPSKVLNLHIESLGNEARESNSRPRLLLRKKRFFSCNPEIWLLSDTVFEPNHIGEEWRDYASISAGQSLKFNQEIRTSQKVEFEEELSLGMSSSLSASLPVAAEGSVEGVG